MTETITYPKWPRKGDLAHIDNDDLGIVLDIQTAKAVYTGLYEVDDEGAHIWIGGDNVIHHKDILAQVFSMRGYEWIQVERLTDASS